MPVIRRPKMTRAERRAKLEATVRIWIEEGHLKSEDSDSLVDDLERILDDHAKRMEVHRAR